MFLVKVCQIWTPVNREFEADVTHVWMNSSFVISEVFFCVEYFITSTTIVCMLGRCGLATYLHHNCCMGWPWLSLQLGIQPGHYCSFWAVSSSQGRMWKRIATDFPAGIFHASSFRVASAPFQKHMYSHTGHRETRNLKGFASSWWVKVSYFLHESDGLDEY